MTCASHRFPLFADIRGRSVLVVGGGRAALPKVHRLLDADARVTLVAPTLIDALAQLASEHSLVHRARAFEPADLDGDDSPALVIAASGSGEHDRHVASLAVARGLWVNVSRQPECGNFIMPSLIERAPLQIAVSSGGSSPILARQLTARLQAFVPDTYGELAAITRHYGDIVNRRLARWRDRRRFWEQVLAGRIGELVLQGRPHRADELLTGALDDFEADKPHGEVYLVGAGPGDPDLLTFRALRLMQQADVVLYDRLVSDAIMQLLPPAVERIYVGKRRSEHALPQQDINERLVELAAGGRRVLRLKGGDPFIFGRGGEEIDLLAAAGISFQVVPGITAAAGCAAYAGIPLTHRDHAQACLFVTGHLKDGTLDLDWRTLVQPHQTVVIYMGLVGLPIIFERLVEHGMSVDTPAAIVARGTTRHQQVLSGTLATLPAEVEASSVQPPTLIIIGEVVRLRERLAWFEPESVEASIE